MGIDAKYAPFFLAKQANLFDFNDEALIFALCSKVGYIRKRNYFLFTMNSHSPFLERRTDLTENLNLLSQYGIESSEFIPVLSLEALIKDGSLRSTVIGNLGTFIFQTQITLDALSRGLASRCRSRSSEELRFEPISEQDFDYIKSGALLLCHVNNSLSLKIASAKNEILVSGETFLAVARVLDGLCRAGVVFQKIEALGSVLIDGTLEKLAAEVSSASAAKKSDPIQAVATQLSRHLELPVEFLSEPTASSMESDYHLDW